MLCELFFLSLFLTAIETLQQIQRLDEKSNDVGVLNCAKTIGKRYFLQPQNVEIISQERIYGFEDFGIVIGTISEFSYPDFRESLTKYAVIFLESVNYEEDLKMLVTLVRSDPQGRFIVSIKKKIDPFKQEEYTKRIISFLTSIERWNVVILTNDSESKTVRVYTYVMFASGDCRRLPKLVDHGSCEDTVALSNLFPALVNFHKCPLHLSTIEFPPFSMIYENNGKKRIRGIESNLVKLIVAKLNATYKVVQTFNGSLLRDTVKKRNADIAWSCLLQIHELGTTWSQTYLINKVLVVIPQSRLMPLWMNLILPFEIKLWATLGTLIGGHLFINLLIPSVRREFRLEWILSGFFGIGIMNLPTRLSHRLYLLSWMIVGYIVMQSYSAGLTGFFASPGQYKQMQTLDELEKSNIVIAGLRNMQSQLAEIYPKIAHDYKVLTVTEYFENIARLSVNGSGRATYAQLDRIRNLTHDRESDFIVIPEHLNFYPIALLLPDFSQILEGCNKVIYHACEAGLITFWDQCFTREMSSGSKPRDESSKYAASLKYLGAGFFVLGIGYCLSSIVFVVEVIFAKLRK